ncbi:MAG: hypothetical protein WAM69_14930 [Candidatus Sulfotelmatobacter sp.]
MKCDPTTKNSDILSNPFMSFALFWLPALAIMASGYDRVSVGWRTGVWTVALTVMGAACIANAARCGRTHCYVTGPFFLLMALGSFLYGVGVIPLGENGWNLIGLAILFGAIALCCLPELLFGKYRRH